MTSLESVLLTLGGLGVGVFGALITTARYYQAQMAALMALVMTKEACKNCQEACKRDQDHRDGSITQLITTVANLASKYDRILKILVLKSSLPDELKQQILP